MTPELSMRPHNGSAPGGSVPIDLAAPEGGVGEFQAILEHAPRDTDRTSRTGGNRPSAPDSRTERESPPNLSKITAGVEDGALRDLPEWLRVALSSNHADSAAEVSEITADIGTAAARSSGNRAGPYTFVIESNRQSPGRARRELAGTGPSG